MSSPTEAEISAALASLAGEEAPDPVADALASAATRLSMIARAQQGGASWSAIASALGAPSGQIAKRDAHRLARRLQSALARADMAAVPDDDLEDSPVSDLLANGGGWIDDLVHDRTVKIYPARLKR